MKVLVTVKEVAALAEDFEIDGTEIEERFLDYELNEWDEYAVEEAVQLAESGVADEVVIATIGPPRAEETMQVPLAKGADRGIRVWDEVLATGDLLDVETRASLLAAVLEAEAPDIVFTGVQAADDGFASTGVALARQVGFEWAAVVNDLRLDLDAGTARVRRELEGAVEEITEVSLPAVFTIQTGINDPRYASLRGIREAQSKEIATKTLADLGLDAKIEDGAFSIVEMAEPVAEVETAYFEGEPAEQAGELAAVLDETGVVGE